MKGSGHILRPLAALALCLLLVLGCFGCAGQPGSLKVYYLETGAQRKQLSRMSDYTIYFDQVMAAYKAEYPTQKVELERFEDAEEMATRIAAETATGKGPDVFLFNSESTVDFAKLAMNGVFADLTEYLAKDETYDAAQYQAAVLASGQIRGGQYLLPLGYEIPYLITTRERISERGHQLDGASFREIMSIICNDVAATSEEDQATFFSQDQRYKSNLYYFMMASGMDIVDMENKKVTLDKEELRPLAEAALAIATLQENLRNVVKAYGSGMGEFISRITFVTDDENILFRSWYYDTAISEVMGKQMKLITFPALQGGDKTSAVVTAVGAVNASSANKDKAYDFLRIALDTEVPFYSYDLSVNRAYAGEVLEMVTETTSPLTFSADKRSFKLAPVSAENADTLRAAMDSVQQARLFNPMVAEIVRDTMADYLAGTMSYDDAYDQLVNRLNLYINE